MAEYIAKGDNRFRSLVCVIKKSDNLFLYIVESEITLEILKHLVIRNLPENVYIRDHHTFQLPSTYSQTCIKRSPLRQRNNGLIRQVTS
jgi:hypothetical protein